MVYVLVPIEEGQEPGDLISEAQIRSKTRSNFTLYSMDSYVFLYRGKMNKFQKNSQRIWSQNSSRCMAG